MKKGESTYEKYFFHIWLAGSFFFSLFYIYVIEGIEFSIERLFPGAFAIVLALPFIAALLYTLFVVFNFGCSIIISSIEDRDPWGVIGAFWVFLGIFMYLAGG